MVRPGRGEYLARGTVATLLAVLTVAACLSASAQAGVVLRAQRRPGAVRRYWTPKRLHGAKPVPLPRLTWRSKLSPWLHPPARAIRPAAPNLSATISSSSGTPVEEPSVYPNRAVGKLYFNTETGDFTCSASVIVSAGKSLIFTAGHCAYDEGEWSENLLFKPAYENGAAPYGSWVIDNISVLTGWTSWEDGAYDFSAMNVYPNSSGVRIQEQVGALGILFNGSPNRYHEVIGYPGTPSSLYNGQEMIRCDTSFVGWDPEWTTTYNGTFAVAPCDQGHGASGGPFITSTDAVQAVTSYSLCKAGEPDNCNDELYGTYFGHAAETLYNGSQAKEPPGPVVPPPAAPAPAPVSEPAPAPWHPARWCGIVRYRLRHHRYTRAARRRSVRNYKRHCVRPAA